MSFSSTVPRNSRNARVLGLTLGVMGLAASSGSALAQTYPQGFTYSGGVYTTLNAPGADFVIPYGVNDAGTIVGFAVSPTVAGPFVYSNGSYNVQNGPANASQYYAAINNSSAKLLVTYTFGTTTPFPSSITSSLVTGSGTTPIVVPGSTNTAASGVNTSGEIVGVYNLTFDLSTGTTSAASFLYNNGVYTTVSVPGSLSTFVSGINDQGQIVGSFTDSHGVYHGFIDTAGSFTTLDASGAQGTYLDGINNAGQIVGTYLLNGQSYGFLDVNGQFTLIDPGPNFQVEALALNNVGEIVGWGLAPPGPIPGAGLSGLGAIALGGLAVRRRRAA